MPPTTRLPQTGIDERQQAIRNRVCRNVLILMSALVIANGAFGNWNGNTFDASLSIVLVCAAVCYVWGMWLEVVATDNGKRGVAAAVLLVCGALRILIAHPDQLQWCLGGPWPVDATSAVVRAVFWTAAGLTVVKMFLLRHEEKAESTS